MICPIKGLYLINLLKRICVFYIMVVAIIAELALIELFLIGEKYVRYSSLPW